MAEMRLGARWVCVALLASACGTSGGRHRSDTSGSKGESDATVAFPDAATDAESPQPDTGGPSACTAGTRSCEGNAVITCAEDGQSWSAPEACPEGKLCTGGACIDCNPDKTFCQGNDVVQCDESGAVTVKETCPATSSCYQGLCLTCTPGAKECRSGPDGTQETWECKAVSATAADWQKTATCPDQADCTNGICVDPCSADLKINTNQGCDYYAVDLQNSTEKGIDGTGPSAADAQFAVIVSNPSAKNTITVTVHETQKAPATITKQIPPKGLEIIKLPSRNVTGTVKGELAWRIKGDHPFVAFQFNPLDNVNPVYSNDASLLLPSNALGRDYLVMTGSGGGAFVTIVATRNGTEVKITPTAATEAGEGIPALQPGQEFSTTLEAGELLNLKAAEVDGQRETLTGTHIESSLDVVVFGGNVATTTGERCCADHLEMQMFPSSVWGTEFVCGKAQARGAEPDHWRILAREDGTTVSFTGNVSPAQTLGAGEYVDITSKADFVVQADKPILVGQFLASSFETLPDGVFCESAADCASGVCNGGPGAGTCTDGCTGAQSTCSTNELCVDNKLVGSDAPAGGGTCFRKPCGTGLGGCPVSAECVPNDDPSTGQCYATCGGVGGCTAGSQCYTGTVYGDLCGPSECFTDGDCGGAWCMQGSSGGVCVRSCTPKATCPNPKDVCLPAGLAADPTITKGVCISSGCTKDADCASGQTCVLHDDGTGNQVGSCEVIGDPSFILAVPSQQWRAEYVFLTPNAYKEDFVNILAPTTAFVQLDGQELPPTAFQTVQGTSWMVARVPIGDGTHTVTATAPVGIVVYGYHDDVSYGYPGGANLFDLGK